MNDKQTTIGLEALRASGATAYCDDRIAFIENLNSLPQEGAVRINMFFMVLCMRGSATITLNDRSFEIGPGELLVCRPNVFLERTRHSDDFDFRCICLSRDLSERLSVKSGIAAWDFFFFIDHSPIVALRPDEVRTFSLYYDLILSRLTDRPRRFQRELTDSLLQAFLFDFNDLLERFITAPKATRSGAERNFRAFITMLTTTYPKPRHVQDYADRLYVTPKYLSAICKRISGRPAADIISYYVAQDVKYQHKKTDKSINEICHELGFPSQSFFGRFTKKHFGKPPRRLRISND